ncbi:DUF885 domain-containing protein [Cellulomonas endophytica]|uniref:DUF885 domain-containing protein n=1 Tax=Cellulomonas endophytica TaxID=2494735 RepID=UPI001010EC48|nr:DUF885 domain-containing protein [Cellulomonas endophytica]
MSRTQPSPRTPSPVDDLAEEYFRTTCRLDPITATSVGAVGYDAEMTDFSPEGHDAREAAARRTLAALEALVARPGTELDATDRVTVEAMRERIGIGLELAAAGEDLRDLNTIASPAQGVRDVFDLMPTSTEGDWDVVARRLRALPASLAGYGASLRRAADAGQVAALRQVEDVVAQTEELADPARSFFTELAGRATDVPGSLREELAAAAAGAREAYAGLARTLREDLAPRAPQEDAVGRERYALWSRAFLGSAVDLEETYAWGVAELDAVIAEQAEIAATIAGPGADLAAATALLEADPARRLEGTDALQRWMQEVSDAAVDALDGTHFTIPEPLRALECRIAPTHTGGIYYTPPSDDFSRPGRMWWSVPESVTSFSPWRERTTVYHEGVPGHHLQLGRAVAERSLNSWRRMQCWVSGHGEGWALYAETLMAEMGFLDDPADRLGLLESRRFRSARVVFDIGTHLGLPVPERWGGGTWDWETGGAFLRENLAMDPAQVRFEHLRYLGWPGQAPSYLIGARLWQGVRADAEARATAAGGTLDVRGFHDRALALGSLPLDVLRTAVVPS